MKRWTLGLILPAALTVGPADAVTAGAGTLELTLSLPKGYHLNEETGSQPQARRQKAH